MSIYLIKSHIYYPENVSTNDFSVNLCLNTVFVYSYLHGGNHVHPKKKYSLLG